MAGSASASRTRWMMVELSCMLTNEFVSGYLLFQYNGGAGLYARSMAFHRCISLPMSGALNSALPAARAVAPSFTHSLPVS